MITKSGLDYESLKSLVENNGGTIRHIRKPMHGKGVIAIYLDGKIGVFPNTSQLMADHFEGLEDLSVDPKNLESAQSLDTLEKLQSRLD